MGIQNGSNTSTFPARNVWFAEIQLQDTSYRIRICKRYDILPYVINIWVYISRKKGVSVFKKKLYPEFIFYYKRKRI